MIKRGMEVIVALIALILFLPIFFLIILGSLLLLGRPIFFTQPRPGKNGRIFHMVKFRTMLSSFDKNGAPLPDAQRLTKFGKFLRSTSLDELPELWNVLKGDMSLVGPRPLLTEYLPLYSEEQNKRHNVRPGITGWAQINGRNALSWDEKFALDVWYVENQSVWLDIKILFLTVKKVFVREGISASNHATAEKFKGNNL